MTSIMEAAPLMAAIASSGQASLEPYGYSESQSALAASVDGFDFSLPASPAELMQAGAELHNCLSSYAHRIPDQSVIVLVRSDKALVAAIELEDNCHRIAQMRAACNERIEPESPLGRAIAEWIGMRRVPHAAIHAQRAASHGN